jgi:hypothetical protein
VVAVMVEVVVNVVVVLMTSVAASARSSERFWTAGACLRSTKRNLARLAAKVWCLCNRRFMTLSRFVMRAR